MPQDNAPGLSTAQYVRRVVIAIVLVALAFLVRSLAGVLLLLFGAVIVAVIVRAAAHPLRRWTRLPERVAIPVGVLLLLAVLGGAGWLFEAQLGGQMAQLWSQLPQAWSGLQDQLGESEWGRQVREALRSASLPDGTDVASSVAAMATALTNAAANLLIVLFAGVYLALEPNQHRDGLVKLFPKSRSEQVRATFDNSGRALRQWLLGQLVSMATVGVLTGVGLMLAGVPAATALAVIAAIAEFVPIVGPALAAIPGLILALSVDLDTALWALLVYVGVQQLESNFITPMVEKKAVSLPPVLTLFGVLAMGILFGPLGIVLATPLVVVIYVVINQVYVRDMLGHDTDVPGEKNGK